MTTPKDKDDFFLKVAYALSGCQLVEQALKLYIAEALELAKQRIGHKIPFKMRGEDYANRPLGQLIDVFHKLSDDETLVKELHKFREKRNLLVTKASHIVLIPMVSLMCPSTKTSLLPSRLRLKD